MPNRPGSEPLPASRFQVERIDGVEWIVARAARHWFAIAFLCVWISFWSMGGVLAIREMVSGRGEPFLLLWLIGWAVGWLFAATMIGWMLAGSVRIGVRSGALEYVWRMPLASRARRYDLANVRLLRPAPSLGLWFGNISQPVLPPFFPSMPGSVQFDYGGRTINVMPGLDQAEGRAIAEWLAKRIPRTATQGSEIN